MDAVVLANYAHQHAPFAIRAMKKGLHVFSEVLPCQTMKEGVELCEAVEETGKIYAYGENYCYMDNIFAMRQRYEAGDIGEGVCLEGTFCNDCSPKWHLLTRGIRDHWRNYVPSTFYCSHSIGPLLFSTGRRPVRVNGLEMPRMDYMAENGARSGSANARLFAPADSRRRDVRRTRVRVARPPRRRLGRALGSRANFDGGS
jgi:predicted dehydrogenase